MNDDGPQINCEPTGNPRCNPRTWNSYGGYTNGCCSKEEQCSINEGDCNFHDDCLGSLVCTPNSCPSSKDKDKTFNKRAACCQQPSGEYIYGIKQKRVTFARLICFFDISYKMSGKSLLRFFMAFIFQNTISKSILTQSVIQKVPG